MNLDDYILDTENVVACVEAYDDKDAMTDWRKGTLAVTPNRVVFVRDKVVSDISLNGVCSVEYRAPSYPYWYLYWSLLFFGGGFGIWFLDLVGIVPSALSPLVLFGGVFGLGFGMLIIVTGFLYRRSMVTLTTPNSEFEFVSNDDSIAEIVHALRGYENR